MRILMSLYNVWCDKLLDGTKTVEFRNNIGKDFKPGDTILLYESARNKGCKKIVGEVKIKSIGTIKRSRMGAYGMMEYYLENIKKDKDALKAFRYATSLDIKNYDGPFVASLMFCNDQLKDLVEKGKAEITSLSNSKYEVYTQNRERAEQLLKECDEWLHTIGYYNKRDETRYKAYIEVKSPKRYKKPKELSSIKDLNGKVIEKAPQSWQYIQ